MRMKPLLKWPGGKGRELAQVYGMIPEYDRYIEPFFGGGALFFRLCPQRAAINDISRDLMAFYRQVQAQEPAFRDALRAYAVSFQGLLELGRSRCTSLLALFDRVCAGEPDAREQLRTLLQAWTPDLLALFPIPLLPDAGAFLRELEEALWDKLCRTARNHQKKPFSPADLAENLVTGLTSGYYLYFRQVYNDRCLGRISLEPGPAMANFFFVRENCYGSMFRYNRAGEFNIPYGGMSYNKKDLSGKVETLLQPETAALFAGTEIASMDFEDFLTGLNLTQRDFLFLDPPYDTEFSDYEGNAFTKLDQARLAVFLSRTPAKFLLIIKRTDFIEDLYSQGFRVRKFDARYTYNVRSRNDRKAEHLIVTNY